jgi:hypothetical protein
MNGGGSSPTIDFEFASSGEPFDSKESETTRIQKAVVHLSTKPPRKHHRIEVSFS